MRTKTGNGHKVDLEQLLEDLKVVVHDGQKLLQAGMSTMKEKALSSAKTTDRAVRERPYQTVAMVFGLGVIVGLLAVGMMRGSSEMEDIEDI
jgi:ElaB/YqjD/DUF883 family membrane-anchored ribosome-binding protein